MRPDELIHLKDPAQTALLFVWGRALPWREYLSQYPQVPLVVLIGGPAGEECMTEPSATALHGAPGWQQLWSMHVDAIHPSAIATAYLRESSRLATDVRQNT